MPPRRRPQFARPLFHPLEPRQLFAASAPGIYPFAPGAPLRVTDSDGTAAVFALSKSGLGQLTIADDLSWHLQLSGTTPKSTLTIAAAGGDARATLAELASSTPIKSIAAPQTILTGPATVSTASLTLAGATHATLTLSSPTKNSSLSLGQLTDTSLTSTTALKSLSAQSWLTSDPASPQNSPPATPAATSPNTLTAPSIASLTITGDFSPNLSLTQSKGTALAKATITGAITGAWTIAGNTGALHLAHLAGNINIAGSAQSTSLADPVALIPIPTGNGPSAPPSAPSIHIAKSGAFTAPGDHFQLNNTTLYPAASPDLYTYEDLHHLTHADESAAYNLNGKRVTQTIQPSANDTYTLQSSPAASQTYALADDGSASLLSITQPLATAIATLTFDTPLQLSPARFTRGQTYTYSSTATIDITDPKNGTIHATGAVTYSTTFQGHQLVKTPAGAYVAAKFQNTLAFTGRGTLTLNGFSADINFSLTTTGPELSTPASAVLSSTTKTTSQIQAPQLHKTLTQRSTTSELLLALPTMTTT